MTAAQRAPGPGRRSRGWSGSPCPPSLGKRGRRAAAGGAAGRGRLPPAVLALGVERLGRGAQRRWGSRRDCSLPARRAPQKGLPLIRGPRSPGRCPEAFCLA